MQATEREGKEWQKFKGGREESEWNRRGIDGSKGRGGRKRKNREAKIGLKDMMLLSCIQHFNTLNVAPPRVDVVK